jgi:hypothetical protein
MSKSSVPDLSPDLQALRGEINSLFWLAYETLQKVDAVLGRIEPAPVAPANLADLLRQVTLAELVPALFDARGQMACARLRTRLNQVLEARSGVRNGGSAHDYVAARRNGGGEARV